MPDPTGRDGALRGGGGPYGPEHAPAGRPLRGRSRSRPPRCTGGGLHRRRRNARQRRRPAALPPSAGRSDGPSVRRRGGRAARRGPAAAAGGRADVARTGAAGVHGGRGGGAAAAACQAGCRARGAGRPVPRADRSAVGRRADRGGPGRRDVREPRHAPLAAPSPGPVRRQLVGRSRRLGAHRAGPRPGGPGHHPLLRPRPPVRPPRCDPSAGRPRPDGGVRPHRPPAGRGVRGGVGSDRGLGPPGHGPAPLRAADRPGRGPGDDVHDGDADHRGPGGQTGSRRHDEVTPPPRHSHGNPPQRDGHPRGNPAGGLRPTDVGVAALAVLPFSA